ncbi:class I SAM-dependent methyltransferase [Dactylosporangium sp. AC04546]|uniref:class I SAM-dependent DNA methyltransferase n=1 Tax=Dactylosporangium sp. AC04546 TaxID=2862460 RepID=UPI001EE0861F|nr:class I SAM-dependent methyltransferase [Dactylosporangium sp. AC04546]WVK87149.1 class I SAM-dependent methyltransferase [Dactylosporangium sp. AC04546]
MGFLERRRLARDARSADRSQGFRLDFAGATGEMTAPDGHDLAAAYDLIYATAAGKDYRSEARDIAELIRRRNPTADSVLDVACGTGLHLSHLRHAFAHVEGLEISDAMRQAAVERLPGITVHAGDMRDFQLGRTFSAVTCLFSAIGYAQSVGELALTLNCLAAHLEPGGVLLLEPWFTPEQWTPGTVHSGVARDDHRHLIRMCCSSRSGTVSTMTMHYVLGEPGVGARHWVEEHVMTLFTDKQYHGAIRQAGFRDIEYLPGWNDQRRRIVAVKG